MANQRSKTKKVVSIPMDEKMLQQLELEAARKGVNRVSLVNEILREALKAAGKLGLIAFISVHCFRSPLNWSIAAVQKTGQTMLAFATSHLK